ncbi:MAG: c-type cytochrome [Magnetococcus sp. YQC-5]
MKKTLLSALLVGLLVAAPVWAKPGDAKKGLEIYNKRCVWCHGEKGDGAGPGAKRMNPPPRDFTSGLYKIKTTDFEDTVPNDDDIYRMIRDGMPGTGMPGWKELLNEGDMWDLVAQIKVFSSYSTEKPAKQVDFGTQIASSPESSATGKKLFLDRCVECHGDEGKGEATKKLKGDAEDRTWPRNLTKPWTFRGSADPKDIYARISVGIPGTQMPSFADPVSKKKLTVEERWHIANYVHTLAKTDKVVRAENTVVQSEKVTGEIAVDPNHASWEKAIPTTFYLVPQIIGKERFFTPSNDTITVRSIYNDQEIALMLEWDDRTNSLPGDETAKAIADAELTEDSVAVQWPVTIPTGMEKPYFGMGDTAHPVNIWQWKSGGKEGSQSVKLMNAKGFGAITARDAASVGLTASGVYAKGTWKVVMKRPRKGGDVEQDLQFEDGRFIPVAFAAWDGSNSEKGSKHTMTTWYWVQMKPAASSLPFLMALLTAGVTGAGLFWWARNVKKQEV